MVTNLALACTLGSLLAGPSMSPGALSSTQPPSGRAGKFQIVAASLFKNGYAVVTRALDVRSGDTYVTEIPDGALGTVWFQVTDGLKITGIKNTFAPPAKPAPRGATSIPELLKWNVGKVVKLGFEKGTVSGRLISLSTDLVLLQSGDAVKAYHASEIKSVVGPQGLKTSSDEDHPSKVRALKISVKGGQSGRIFMMALEHGLSWSPAYSLDMTNPTSLKVTMKATLVNDLGAMKGIETRLVTGFPNVLYSAVQDPIFAQASLDQYLANISASDAQRSALKSNLALANSPMMGQQAGIGGGAGGRSYRLAMARGFATSDASVSELGAQDGPGGIQAEDLYFYRLQDVDMDLGDRSYFVLKAGTVPYKDLYTWEGTDPVIGNINFGADVRQPNPNPTDDQVEPVWHALEFENKLGLPLTTAPAVTMQSGELLGQDLMHYTSQGAKATVRITKALDVEADSYNEEASRESNALRVSDRYAYDLVHVLTTMSFVNHKPKAVHLKLSFPYTGVVEDPAGGTEVKQHKRLHDMNPTGKLTWERDLEAGQSLSITFKTKVFVNPHNI